jgi:transcriptional regulator with XRE-family HTH domain
MVDSTETTALAKRLGGNIARRRKELGLTQAALAERLGMEPETVSRCERGAALPSVASLVSFAQVLGTTLADLLAEMPGEAYPEAQRLTALLAEVPPEARAVLISTIETLCGLLRPKVPPPDGEAS